MPSKLLQVYPAGNYGYLIDAIVPISLLKRLQKSYCKSDSDIEFWWRSRLKDLQQDTRS